jgi:hypothetical protein
MPTAEEMCNSGREAVRCFLPNAVPVAEAPPPEALRQLEAGLVGVLEGGLLKRWPSKQKQQAAVTAWLSSQMARDRVYAEAEMDWLIVTRHACSVVPDCPTIRKEFERRGHVMREPGGGGFKVIDRAMDRAVLESPGACP